MNILQLNIYSNMTVIGAIDIESRWKYTISLFEFDKTIDMDPYQWTKSIIWKCIWNDISSSTAAEQA